MNTDITPNIFIARIPGAARLLHTVGVMNAEHYDLHKKGVFKNVSYLNVAKPFPYAAGTVESVFTSHMLEHLHPCVAEHFFSEVFRVLQSGGIFRVTVPDLEWAIGLFDETQPDRFLNAMYEHVGGGVKNSHKWMYTRSSLKALFVKHGFVEVEICNYREGRLPNVELMDSRHENSLFVEGKHP